MVIYGVNTHSLQICPTPIIYKGEIKMSLLKNGLIYDGSLNPPFVGSILIENDRIVEIRKENKENYDGEIIDCTGLVVAPGFIDAHSHNDFYTTYDDNLKYFLPFAEQGITSMITGNCGFSPAGYAEDTKYRDLIGGGLFSTYPPEADYSSLKAWINSPYQKTPLNIFPLVGHGTVRMGINGKKPGRLTEDELKTMLTSVEESLKDGAYGVSLGLMYEPGLYAPYDELLEVAKLVKKYDRILTVHNRAQSKISTSYSPPIGGRAHNLRAIDEMIEIAKATKVKLQNSHLIFVGAKSFDTVDETLELINQCNNEGCDFGFDIYSLTYGASIITVILPGWYLMLEERKRKSIPVKLRLWAEVLVARKALGLDFGDILISDGAGYIDEYEGMYVSDIAGQLKQSPLKTYIDLVDKSNGTAGVYIKKYSNEEVIKRLLKHDSSILMTDAWLQPKGVQNGATYYGMVKFLLMARNGEFSLEEIINKMTKKTAERYKIKDRGSIEAGRYADITIFDYNNMSIDESKMEKPQGIKYVFINGIKVIDQGVTNYDLLGNSGVIS